MPSIQHLRGFLSVDTLIAILVTVAMPAIAQAGPVACSGGKIPVRDECVEKERVRE